MAEYINKAELEKFKYLSVVTYEGGKKENKAVIVIGCELFNELPTIDIVTCRNCKHADRTICLTSFPEKFGCKLGNGAHRLDWFCADGEREVTE